MCWNAMNLRVTMPFVCVLGLSSLSQAGSLAQKQEQKKETTFEEAIADHELLTGYLPVYKGKKDLLVQLAPDQLNRRLGYKASLVGAIGDYFPRNTSVEFQVVTFERWGNSIALIRENTLFRADEQDPIRRAVEASFPDSPVLTMPIIATEDSSGSVLINLTPALNSKTLRWLLPPETKFDLDKNEFSLLSVQNHPKNLAVTVGYHFTRRQIPSDQQGSTGFSPFRERLVDPRNLEVRVRYEFFDFPETDYRSRVNDDRLGLFTNTYKNYSNLEQKDTTYERFATRWRLEPVEGKAINPGPVPVKESIVLYIDKAAPKEVRPLIREGVLRWNPAFEKIGLSGVLEVRDQPDDPDWSPTEIGHNMIYWHLGDQLQFSGMAGIFLANPETGQALHGAIYLNALFPSFARNGYMVYSWWPGSEVRNRIVDQPHSCAYQPSLSSQIAFARLLLRQRGDIQTKEDADELFRQTFLTVVTHEVGHFLGFEHNFKASRRSSYKDLWAGEPVALTGSVMDYNPIHLPTRPEKPVRYTPQQLGIYDELAVEYLYRDFGHLTSEAERKELDRIAQRAEVTPGLAFASRLLREIDPATSPHDLGDDALSFVSDRLEMALIEILPNLVSLVTAEGHELNYIRQALDAAVISVCMDFYNIAVRHIGGQSILKLHVGSPVWKSTPPITPVAKSHQLRALEILDKHLFSEAAFPFTPELLAHLQPDLEMDWNHPDRYGKEYFVDRRMAFLFDKVLSQLLDARRLARVRDNENRYRHGEERFTLAALFEQLDKIIWRDIQNEKIHPFRRILQVEYADKLVELVSNPGKGMPVDASSLATLSLTELLDQISSVDISPNRTTQAHRLALTKKLEKALDVEGG